MKDQIKEETHEESDGKRLVKVSPELAARMHRLFTSSDLGPEDMPSQITGGVKENVCAIILSDGISRVCMSIARLIGDPATFILATAFEMPLGMMIKIGPEGPVIDNVMEVMESKRQTNEAETPEAMEIFQLMHDAPAYEEAEASVEKAEDATEDLSSE